MSIVTDRQQIDGILNRGVITDILPDKQQFRDKLLKGEKMKFYIGVDPTSTSLHLSHAKNYMILEEFRQLGHEVITLFGDFTARIGDPTEREAARKQLSPQEVKDNVKEWLKQIKPLLDFDAKHNPPQVLYNSQWLASLSFEEVIDLAANFTVQQMIERDMFKRRLKKNQPIYLHEFLYPLMQGYDSVAMEVDVELCGTDQTFNAMAGRLLSKRLLNKDKYVVVTNLMENPKTGELMSKSRGTGVFLGTSAEDMYGSIMAQPDEMTELLLINNTRLPLDEVKTILKTGPKDAKSRAALEIVTIFYGSQQAAAAQTAWLRQFSNKEMPADIPEQKLEKPDWDTAEVLINTGLVESKSEARRLLEQGGVRVNGQSLDSETVELSDGDILQVGKRRFIKVRL